MKVETYEIDEVRPDCQDDKTELLALAEQLGLKGQRKLLSTETVTTFPYRVMTEEEDRVYSTLLGAKVELAEFQESVIPIRVMQVAAHASEYEQTRHLVVWFSRSDKDPLLVGQKGPYEGPHFLLARWGDVLDSMAILKEKAFAKLVPIATVKIAEARSALLSCEGSIEDRCRAYLSGANIKYAPDVF